MTLKQRIEQVEAEKQIIQYARLMATGKFHNTGKLYSPTEARQDASKSELRKTAIYDNGKLSWK